MDKSLYPTWLTSLGFRAPGIGSHDDLHHTIMAGERGKWLSFINPGWYYLDGDEDYFYRQQLSATGTGTITSSEDSFWPQRGPVLASNNTGQLTQVDNLILGAQSVTWTSLGNNLYSTTHSSIQTLLNVRSLSQNSLSMAPATGSLLPDISYVYDEGTREVFVKSAASPNDIIYLDVATSSASLNISEVLYTDWESKVYPSYSQYSNLILTRGGSTQNIGTGSGGVTSTISSQTEWVRADYQVPNSYILQNHKVVITNATGTTTVLFEGSAPPIIQPLTVANDPTGEFFNVNPLLKNSPFVGYLFSDIVAPTYTPERVSISTDRSRYRVSAGEQVKFVITVFSNEKIPIPWSPIEYTLTGHSDVIAQFPDPAFDAIYDYTDAAGRKLLYCTGTGDITLTVVAGSASGTVTVINDDEWVPSSNRYLDGLLSITATPIKIANTEYFESYFSIANLDGVPTSTNNDPATLYLNQGAEALTKNSSGFFVNNSYSVSLSTDLSGANPIGISEKFGLLQSLTGVVWAYKNGVISKKIKALAGESW